MSDSTPSPTPAKSRSSYRLFYWMMALLVLGVISTVLLILLPLNGWVIATILLFLGILMLVAGHYAFWAWLQSEEPDQPVVIPPDPQGRRGPPHRNGSARPGDPFYCK